jgi:L-histidine N-alpha-methyltransferase
MVKRTPSGRMMISKDGNRSLRDDLARDVSTGLTAPQKSIPSKYFYDANGSRLFESICLLPEYYQTRTELSILRTHAPVIMEDFREGALIELGSGTNWKIRALLDAAYSSGSPHLRYVPVDVSAETLVAASSQLIAAYPGLEVRGVIADFTTGIGRVVDGDPRLITFFGSTIGNFDQEERVRFLSGIARSMAPCDRMLLGLDLVKPVSFIERAYNDSRGVTAAFNKNVLHVINRELGGDFKTEDFDHSAFFNSGEERIEMHLRARRRVTARLGTIDLDVGLSRGETIMTEISVKFSRETVEQMANDAGLKTGRQFSDPRGWFTVVELMRADLR